ncbi:MAG: hypothetical protein EZS28_014572 [Streblomastix strix]|uniref:Uncharacterized protein n=1 Tax=Streblomastix strix TaxID=222440 RepID=A0A5J4W581_9EUKA|nr:MAG: hypothetical protein EZS28_014572 [Streblomastix strix]
MALRPFLTLSTLLQKDPSLELFHIIGKLLANKRQTYGIDNDFTEIHGRTYLILHIIIDLSLLILNIIHHLQIYNLDALSTTTGSSLGSSFIHTSTSSITSSSFTIVSNTPTHSTGSQSPFIPHFSILLAGWAASNKSAVLIRPQIFNEQRRQRDFLLQIQTLSVALSNFSNASQQIPHSNIEDEDDISDYDINGDDDVQMILKDKLDGEAAGGDEKRERVIMIALNQGIQVPKNIDNIQQQF